ncbi:MAG: tripartite tricarboxylate transporter TctB family protein [Clostridia bacterium]|nr:tripartite tricarboxylate transporter TctB family protein [Clostridia bacterium]
MAHKKLCHELVIGAVIYAFLIFAFVITNSMLPDSALFPRMIIALFALLNTIMVVQAFTGKYQNKFTMRETLMPLLYFAGIIAYVFLFKWLGYFPATAVMMVAYMFVLKVRPIWKIGVITCGYLVFIYLLFVVWLKTSIV